MDKIEMESEKEILDPNLLSMAAFICDYDFNFCFLIN